MRGKYTMIYSGGDEHKNGVGIILRIKNSKFNHRLLASIRQDNNGEDKGTAIQC